MGRLVEQDADEQDQEQQYAAGQHSLLRNSLLGILALLRILRAEIEREDGEQQKEGMQPDVHAVPPAEINAPTGRVRIWPLSQSSVGPANLCSWQRFAIRPLLPLLRRQPRSPIRRRNSAPPEQSAG